MFSIDRLANNRFTVKQERIKKEKKAKKGGKSAGDAFISPSVSSSAVDSVNADVPDLESAPYDPLECEQCEAASTTDDDLPPCSEDLETADHKTKQPHISMVGAAAFASLQRQGIPLFSLTPAALHAHL